jgi:uncharacterized membrane protein YfcA
VDFPISGVEVFPLVPVLVGFAIASFTTPAGVSGAFLLLPFQFSVLGFTAPGVTPTNLLYNVISTPGGVWRYLRQGSVDFSLVRAIATGAVPGVIAGSVLRVTLFDDPGTFKAFVGAILFLLGTNIVAQATRRPYGRSEVREHFSHLKVFFLGASAGIIGGIYGVSGGSIVAPVLAGVFGLSVKRVAAAALVATFITSVVGVLSFQLLALRESAPAAAGPDWMLALLFGLGGALGGFTGARLNDRFPERGLRFLLGALAMVLAAFYVIPVL